MTAVLALALALVGPAPATPAQAAVKAIAADHVVPRGWIYGEFACLDTLWQRESRWDPQARNRRSGASGLPQLMSPRHVERLPVGVQIDLGAAYIAGRYGTPCRALAHSYRYGFY